jgi:hypothetical protein
MTSQSRAPASPHLLHLGGEPAPGVDLNRERLTPGVRDSLWNFGISKILIQQLQTDVQPSQFFCSFLKFDRLRALALGFATYTLYLSLHRGYVLSKGGNNVGHARATCHWKKRSFSGV